MLLENILLEPEQQELLCKFVEAERGVPKGQRGKFIAIQQIKAGTSADFIYNSARGISVSGSVTDAEILAENGLLGLSYGSQGSLLFHVRPEGFQYYREFKQASQPAEAVEKEVRGHLSSNEFKNSCPAAFKKWSDAEAMLWESDSDTQFTTIGHLCREAIQEFADALVNKHKPPDVDSDKAHTISRVRSILELHASDLGSTEKQFLEQLLCYWRSVSNLVQRQEHGGQRNGASITWEDARRVVFQTCIVMYEVDHSLSMAR